MSASRPVGSNGRPCSRSTCRTSSAAAAASASVPGRTGIVPLAYFQGKVNSYPMADTGVPQRHGSRTVGVLGASGYAGAELLRLLAAHPDLAVICASGESSAGLVEADGIVIDAKSGISGAGRSLKDAYLFVQANENVNPYGVGTHRHTPEIEQELGRAAGRPLTVVFTPHLVPLGRGLLATCYGALAPGAGRAELSACLADAYGDEPFVDLVGPDGHPGLQGAWPSTRAVATTNRAQVAATADPRTGRLVAAAAIDNLVKGAAGQAVQCANLALGLPETTGLELVPPGP